MKPSVPSPPLKIPDLVKRLLNEPDTEKRSIIYNNYSSSVKLVEALKAEVDHNISADVGRAILASERAFEASHLLNDSKAKAIGNWAYALGLNIQQSYTEALEHFQQAKTIFSAGGQKNEAALAFKRYDSSPCNAGKV